MQLDLEDLKVVDFESIGKDELDQIDRKFFMKKGKGSTWSHSPPSIGRDYFSTRLEELECIVTVKSEPTNLSEAVVNDNRNIVARI